MMFTSHLFISRISAWSPSMDDDKGLELSLGLACGGSSSTSKDRSSNSADAKTDPDERTNKILNDFKNFLSAVPQSLPRNDAVKPQENFFSNLQQNGNGENVSGDEPGVGNKRKSTFEETNDPKKQETDSRNSVIQDKDKMSHISITTDEGSTADNEDVAESEAEGSTSKLASHHEDGSRTPGGSGSSSQAPKELCGKPNSSAPFTVQAMNNMNVPYSITIKEPPSASAPSTPSYPLPGMMQGITSANGERPRLHATALGSLPMSFGYSPVQLPVLDNKDSPWRMATQPQSIPATYAGISISTSVPMQAINSSSESARLDVHPSEQPKGQPLLVAEEGSSSQVEGDAKGRGSSFPSEYPAIRPGIASEMNFGGSGSFPNLPWVSTTSPGPNGKTISGVTYKYNATQIKIVCACHGVHMSPEEFVRHATEEEQTPVTTPNLTSLRSTNPTTSAKS